MEQKFAMGQPIEDHHSELEQVTSSYKVRFHSTFDKRIFSANISGSTCFMHVFTSAKAMCPRCNRCTLGLEDTVKGRITLIKRHVA